MTRTQKVVLVALALIALVFIALIVWGANRPSCQGRAADCARSYSPGAAMQAMGRLFSSAGTKVTLPRERFEFTSATSLTVDIARSGDTHMRTLRLRQVQGGIELSLFNVDREPELSDQETASPLPRAASGADDGRSQSFAVTPGGGRLTIACLKPPCVLVAD